MNYPTQTGGGMAGGVLILLFAVAVGVAVHLWYTKLSVPLFLTAQITDPNSKNFCSDLPQSVVYEAAARGVRLDCQSTPNRAPDPKKCLENRQKGIPPEFYKSQYSRPSGRLDQPLRNCDGMFTKWNLADFAK